MTVGERIKELRIKLGMSQVDFADKINVSKQTLYKYENNIITNIPSDKIAAAADLGNVSPSYIMGWKENIAENKDIDESDPDIRRIQRAREKMPESGRAYMMDMLKRSFSEYFEDDGEDDPD